MSTFKNVSSSEFHNKQISLKCLVSGKSTSPYAVPKKIKFDCIPNEKTDCQYCIYKSTKPNEIEIKPVDEKILKFVDVNDSLFERIIRDMFFIPCKIRYEILEVQNIERIFILPPLRKDRGKSDMIQLSYYVGYGINTNTIYDMIGYTTVDPKNQAATHVFTRATKVRSDIESFTLNEPLHHRLMDEFNIKEPTVEKIYDYLYDLYDHYSHNITKIYNRFDLHLAVDIVTKSVLSFNFDNEFVHRGWMDAMILGDTRCGKGYVTEKLFNYFDIGEVVSGENISFAGLVGGLDQINRNWVVKWGKIPMNDGGLVCIDEAAEIPLDTWTKLSRIRSEGVAEITKIQTQITNARTRLLFLTNPINKTVANYSYGIQALQDIIKTPEDIARFDYVLIVAHNEVSIQDINKHHVSDAKKIHNSVLEHDLILWTWSRKHNEVLFSQAAIDKVYKMSIELSKQYSLSIPLIQGENIRVKLAKIAIAFAARTYSNKDNGKFLFVDSCHVDCAVFFLHMIYKKDACGYYAMSHLRKDIDISYEDKDFDSINRFFDSYGSNKQELCRCLLNNNVITDKIISEHMNLSQELAREVISKLLKSNHIVAKSQGYIKVPAFNSWLKKLVIK